MPKITKKEQAREDLFAKDIAPLMDRITELCNENDMPLLVAVQLYTSKTTGARIAAQAIETKGCVLPLKISSKLLRGQAKIALDSETSFYVTIADDEGKYKNPIDIDQLETLKEHSEHCSDCKEHMEDRMANGEDISNVRIMGDHGDSNFYADEFDTSNPLGLLTGFFSKNSGVIH